MTRREINKHLGIPSQTLRNWSSSNPKGDWRYKLLMFLESPHLTPAMVEDAMTDKPELTSSDIATLKEAAQALKGISAGDYAKLRL